MAKINKLALLNGYNIHPVPLEFGQALSTSEVLGGMQKKVNEVVDIVNDFSLEADGVIATYKGEMTAIVDKAKTDLQGEYDTFTNGINDDFLEYKGEMIGVVNTINTDISTQLATTASKQYVREEISKAQLEGAEIDTSNFVVQSELATYKKKAENLMLKKDVAGEFIHVEDSAEWDVLGIEVEGKTVVTKANPELPISPTNVAQFTSVENPTIMSCGKNLLENKAVSKVDQGLTWTVNSDKSISVKGTALARTNIILLGSTSGNTQVAYFPSGVSYKVSGVPSNNPSLLCRTVDGVYHNMTGSTTWVGKGISVIYLEVAQGATVDTTVKPMIEVGTVATEYEPFKGISKVTIPYGLRSLPNGLMNTYKDGIVTIRVGVAIFDGSSDEQIIRSDTNTAGNLRFGIINNLLTPSINNTSIPNIHCNRFEVSSAEQNYFNKECCAIGMDGRFYLYYEPISNYTIEEFRAWLQANPIIVYYEHKVYGSYPITNGLVTCNNVTNVFSNTNISPNLKVKYARDINTVISKLGQ